MDVNFNPKIIIVPDQSRRSSSSDMITRVFTDILTLVHFKELSGDMYYAVDYENAPEFSENMRSDILVFDRTSSEEEAQKRLFMAKHLKLGGIIFLDIEDPFLKPAAFGKRVTAYTYSADDDDANFYAQKIRRAQDGTGFTFEYVFQTNPSGKFGLRTIFNPGHAQNYIFTGSAATDSRKDIIHAVKAFALCLIQGIDTKYVIKAISNYDFSLLD